MHGDHPATNTRFNPPRLRWLAALSIIVFVPQLALRAYGAASHSSTIENDLIAVTLQHRSAAITAVRSKTGQTPFENPATTAEVLRLEIPIGDWDGHAAVGSQSEGFRVIDRSKDTLTLETAQLKTSEGEFPVLLTLRFRLEEDNLVTQVHVENRGSHTIDQVTFPMLDVGPAADASESLTMTSGQTPLRQMFSQNTIRTRHDPFERLDPEDMRGWIYNDPAFSAKAWEYPSGLTMHSAWMSYQAADWGVGWDVRDKSFQAQFAAVERRLQRDRVSVAANRQTYQLSWRWSPRIGPGQSWESPEIYLKFHSGDWHAVAKQHREWLQTWLPRPTVAPKFQESLGWVSRGISSFEQIPGIARTAVDVGAPYVLLYGWYGGGMSGLSYGFFPQAILGGEASLRENLAKARSLGAYPLAWYNGTTTAETAPEHREQAHDWVVVNRHGGLLIDGRWTLFDPDRPTTTDDAVTLMNLDMGSEAAAFNIENVRRMIQDYGFSGFEMDQGAKNYVSYSQSGGSPQPELRYTEGARALYEASRKIVKDSDPNGIVIGEGISDFMNQYMDSSWIFEGGWVLVPYHTFFRYSLPWATMPAGIFTPDAGYANQAFLMNSPLDIFLDPAAHPQFRSHLRKLSGLKQAVHRYLYDGDFSDGEGFVLHAPPTSGLMAKSYIERGRRIAIVVVNIRDAQEIATLDLAGAPGKPVVLYRLDGSTESLQDAGPVELQLGAFDINVVVAEEGAAP